MQNGFQSSQALAASITKASSKQTYYTVRYLVDRERVGDAYCAYAYFRWLDDRIDQALLDHAERVACIGRQKAIVDRCYQNQRPGALSPEENMLADLILADQEKDSGLQSYIRNMMAVMDFDVRRRGRMISRLELTRYTRSLATAVTEALLYFIGHGQHSPQTGARYLAVTGAHIVHMLRDTLEDIQAGYFNIPCEFLAANGIDPWDVNSDPYRAWTQKRADVARACFKCGKEYLSQLESIRCRIAGQAYIARFEGTLKAIERLDYRPALKYPQSRGVGAAIWMSRSVLSLAFLPRRS